MPATRATQEANRLLEMIRQAGVPLAPSVRFQQTYASRSQRAEGGAVWILVDDEGRECRPHVCSIWPRRELLKMGVTAWCDWLGEWHVDPARI